MGGDVEIFRLTSVLVKKQKQKKHNLLLNNDILETVVNPIPSELEVSSPGLS